MILAGIQASVAVAPAPLLATGLVQLAAGSAAVELTVDPAPLLAALPARSPDRRQICGLLVRLDGVEIPRSKFTPDCQVTLALAPLQRWTLAGPLPGPFGSARAYRGAAPGKRRIDISGVYLTPQGLVEVPLVSNALVDNETRSRQADGTQILTVTGSDSTARIDHRLVDYVRAPGLGLRRADVVREILEAAGATAANVTLSGTVNHEVQVIAQEPFSAAQPLADVEGHGLGADRYGAIRSAVAGYSAARRVALTLTDQDVLFGSESANVKGDIYTRITLTGSQTVLSEGLRTVTKVDVGQSLYAPRQAAFVQGSDGSLTALGTAPPPRRLQITSMVKTVSVYSGETLLSEEVTTWGFRNQEVARYVLQADGTVEWVTGGLYGAVYLYDGAAANDNSPAYHLSREVFLVVGRQRTTYSYDDRHYLAETRADKDFPFFRLAATQHRDGPSETWESVGFIAGTLLLGNRAAVDNGGAVPGLETLPYQTTGGAFGALVPREIATTRHSATDDGYLTAEATATQTFAAAEGSLYRYADGTTVSGAAVEQLADTARQETYYSAVGDSGHSDTVLKYENGALVSVDGPNLRDGSLPAATKDLSADPAARQKGQAFRVEEIDYAREAVRTRAETTVSNPYVETPEEGLAFVRRMLREDGAGTVSVSIPANFYVDPDWLVRLDLKTVDLLGDGPQPIDLHDLVVTHACAAPDGPFLTTISGRCYL